MVLTLFLLFGLLSTPVATPVELPSAPTWTVPTGVTMETTPGARARLLIVDDMVIVASPNRTLRALDARTGDLVWTTPMTEDVAAPMASRGETLLVPGGQGTLFTFELETGRMTEATVLGAEPLLEPLVIGESIVAGDARGTVHIIDAQSFEPQATIVIGGTVRHAVAAGKLGVFASDEGTVSAIDPATASAAWQAVVPGKPAQIEATGDGIAVGMDSGDLLLLNATDGSVRWHQAAVASPFTDIAVAGTEVVGITDAGDLLVVDAASGATTGQEVLPAGGWFAGDQCDPGCPVVTTDGSVLLFAPGSGQRPVAVAAIPPVPTLPAASGDVLVVMTGQGDVHGWVLNPE